ncbi:MAG: ABC transporter substrate-binding protein [Actinomycetota bacterium]|nr:ABC transporter substrate-binding protein [Actinomycetota bacterium]
MKRWRIVIMIAVFALLAAACANEGDTTTTAASGGEETTTTAASGGEETTTTAASGGEETTTTAAAPAGESTGYADLDKAFAGEYAGTEVEILSQWIATEGANFAAAMVPFIAATGIQVKTEGITNYETVLTTRVDGNNAPDIAQIAQPGKMQTFASEGKLVPLGDWFSKDQLATDYIQSFIDLGSYEGDVYGVFYKGDLKSIVWYPVDAFAANGYEIPATWDELTALSDTIVADGNGNPWCTTIEHGDASGWVATDWLEDILLRTAPTDIYDQWVAHEIPFNHPEVLEAAEYMKTAWFTPDYVYGGNTRINATWVGDSQTPMFDPIDQPKCWMHKQAAWIPDFWPKDADDNPIYTPGVESSFFYFPPIEAEFGSPVLGSGDQFMMFNDRPEVRAVMEFLATPDAAKGWIERGGFVSPNQSVPLDWYTAYPNDELAAILNGADTFRFDGSDIMPAEVGAGSFWAGMVDWVAANGEGTEAIFQTIEDGWPTG